MSNIPKIPVQIDRRYGYKYTDAASENPINKSIVTTETSNSITGKLNQEPRKTETSGSFTGTPDQNSRGLELQCYKRQTSTHLSVS